MPWRMGMMLLGLLGVACARAPAAAPPTLGVNDPAIAAALAFLHAVSDGGVEDGLALVPADQRGDTARLKVHITSLQLKGCQGNQMEPTARTGDDTTEAVVTVRFAPPCGHRTVIRASEVDEPLSACRLGLRREAGTWRALPLAIQCPPE